MGIIETLLPTFTKEGMWELLWNETWATLQMVFIPGIFIFVFGLLVGVILVVTKKGGILENLIVWNILDKLVNLFRAIPFLILIILLIPTTRSIMGTAIGIKGAIFPLTVGTIPFFARQVESTLSELDYGLIEASVSMGDSPFQTILRVFLKESVPGLIRATTITLISLIGYVAMAGSVGAGGLGNMAIQYGYVHSKMDVVYMIVVIILVIITLIQSIGDFLADKTTH